jgi:hypothetical protein
LLLIIFLILIFILLLILFSSDEDEDDDEDSTSTMRTYVKPLFRPEAVLPKLSSFALPPRAEAGRKKLAEWAALLDSPSGHKKKETELLGDFLRDVFADLLGYTTPPADPYTLKREALVKVGGKFADAAPPRMPIS